LNNAIWLQISGENCHCDTPLQNIVLLSKYTSVTFNILAFISIYVCLCTKKGDVIDVDTMKH